MCIHFYILLDLGEIEFFRVSYFDKKCDKPLISIFVIKIRYEGRFKLDKGYLTRCFAVIVS